MSILLKDVDYVYMPNTPFERAALRGINLEIRKGEFVAVIGHTGSGKSTLAQHLNGLLHPVRGTVAVDGMDLAKKTALRQAAQKVGMVFQYPEHQLFEETIYEDIAFGPRNLELPADVVDERVRGAMKFVGLDFETYQKRSPFQLSGGQMRRVAIAGVIALKLDYLVLDEPSAGLDPRGRDAIFAKFEELHKKKGIGIVLVSHNMDDVARLADRVIVMNQGQIIIDAPPAAAFEQTERLREAGVDVPQATRLLQTLRRHGIQIAGKAVTLQESVAEIMAAIGRK